MVHKLRQFALWKLPEPIDVLLVMKEFIELLRICPIQVVETLEGHDRKDRLWMFGAWGARKRCKENTALGSRTYVVSDTSESRGGADSLRVYAR